LSRATRCHELVFNGHDVVLELNDNNLEGKNKICIGISLVLEVGIGELSLHFKINISVGFIISPKET